MRFDVVRPQELTTEHCHAWSKIQRTTTTLESPFFSHGFTTAVGAARDDSFVGIIEDAGDIAGFFPFHRRQRHIGAPIGGPICDCQGVIISPETDLSPAQLLKGCALNAYDFNHAPTTQKTLSPSAFAAYGSPILDLSDGFEAYRSARLNAGTNELKNTERKIRKIEREIGALRFLANDKNSDAWQKLIEWKNASYMRLNVSSILNQKWVRDCLEHIRDTDTPDFSGMLSTLYAGDKLIAVHFGMRSHRAWHWWFPTYDITLEKYSPGLALLTSMARWAPENGLERIDLGRGDSRYKRAFASTTPLIKEGSIELSDNLPGALRRMRKLCHSAAKLTGSERIIDFQRRNLARLLKAGELNS